MAYPRYLEDKARCMRRERRLTLDEIAQRLALPRTTVGYWIRDLPLDRPRRASVGQRKGNTAMRGSYRRRREAAYARGVAEFDRLAEIPTFRDFVVRYIAEGYKHNRNVAPCATQIRGCSRSLRGGSAPCRTNAWSFRCGTTQTSNPTS